MARQHRVKGGVLKGQAGGGAVQHLHVGDAVFAYLVAHVLAQAVAGLAGVHAQAVPRGGKGQAARPRAHIQHHHAGQVNQFVQPLTVPISDIVDALHHLGPGIDDKGLVILQEVHFGLAGCLVVQVLRHHCQRRVHKGRALRRLVPAKIRHMGVAAQRAANQGLVGRMILFTRLVCEQIAQHPPVKVQQRIHGVVFGVDPVV